MAFSTFKLVRRDITQRSIRRRYALVPSAVGGQGYTTGGDTVDFTAATNPNKQERPRPPAKPGGTPGFVVEDVIVTCPGGYTGQFKFAAVLPTLKNCLLMFFTAANAEVPQADYPALLAGGTVIIEIVTALRKD